MKNHKGYSLIELVVVAGLLGMIGVVAISLFLSTLLGGGKSTAQNDVRANGDFAMVQMERMIRNARYVYAGGCSSNMTSLDIKNPDGGITTFTANGTQIASNSSMLTSADVSLVSGSLLFDCVRPAPKAPEVINIRFSLEKGEESTPRDFARVNFETTVQMRSF